LAIFIHGGFGISGGDPFVYQLADAVFQPYTGETFEKTGPSGRRRDVLIPWEERLDQENHIRDLADMVVQTYDDTCGEERVILFGYSRGGVTAQLIADRVFSMRPEAKIDLMITVGAVESGHPPSSRPVGRKMPNVKKHMNFISEQGEATRIQEDLEKWPHPLPGRDILFGELSIDGASNTIIDDTSHMGIIAPQMPLFKTVSHPPSSMTTREFVAYTPNPVWRETKAAIQALYIP
jgi:pimeloyl-ACP methyl ester carboxylesterase